VDDSATATNATEPDAAAPLDRDADVPGASPDSSAPTAGGSDVDATSSAADASTKPDASSTCSDPAAAKLSACASDGALSSSIGSCRQYCQSRGSCCSTTACTFVGVQVAGTWSQLSVTCSISPDYEMTSCDEPIRGNAPGYFRCCCY
jgi:hypothetical protein